MGRRRLSWQKYTLHFKKPGGTSRGVLHHKVSYFLKLEDQGKTAYGECGILHGLSADDRPDYEDKLNWLSNNISLNDEEIYQELNEFPSIQFGWEQALLDLHTQSHILFPSDFTAGKACQPINGLIWMGDVSFMDEQIDQRLQDGFQVLKMKIGAINLNEELNILQNIRKQYSKSDLELRVDANGAFSFEEAKVVMDKLAELEVHSIEQPLKKGQWKEMADLCKSPAIPVALDEELIGVFSFENKRELVLFIQPQYLILKPSFIGGFTGSEEWIKLAEEFRIGWWATSALESNIGLNAIAQWNFIQNNPIASGLGTGSLYTNNIKSPLTVEKGMLCYKPAVEWDTTSLK